MKNKIIEEFYAFGHPNILGLHKTTIEITKEPYLTLRGDCIIGVRSEKGLAQFSNEFKNFVRNENAIITCKLYVNNLIETIIGYGHPNLTYKDPTDIVIRKSSFICDRTAMIKANKSAIDLNRDFIQLLKNSNVRLKVKFEVEL